MEYHIDPGACRFTVRAFASGMLSSVGHNPTFQVRELAGRVTFDPAAPGSTSLRLRVGASSLALTDSVFGPQSLRLEFVDDHATVAPSADPGTVRCDVAIFSQIYCGALSAKHARWYGMLEADDEAVELLDYAFPPGPPFIAPFDWF